MILRQYKTDENNPQFQFYKQQHSNQTLEFAFSKFKQYRQLNKGRRKIQEIFSELDSYIDPSDPDLSIPNSIHAYQTAERIRLAEPNNKDLQICGLIHDFGKILYIYGEPDWAVVGDTYPLGCKFSNKIVYYDTFKDTKMWKEPIYNQLYGIYTKGCGLRNLIMTWGHDEYLYNVLRHNRNHKLPIKYMNIIRFHSFYSWHTGGDYMYFMNERDNIILEDIKHFNSFDLYSKVDDIKISLSTKNYYEKLLEEYFPEPLSW